MLIIEKQTVKYYSNVTLKHCNKQESKHVTREISVFAYFLSPLPCIKITI